MPQQLTARDKSLIAWINSYGFVQIQHIANWFKISLSWAYALTDKLLKLGYLQHDYVFHGAPGVFRATRYGALVANSELPALRKIRIETFWHDLQVLELSLCLIRCCGAEFITERQLRQQQAQQLSANYYYTKTHLSDGALMFDNCTIAIEIERSSKSIKRRAAIMQHYLHNLKFQQVYYFCNNKIIQRQVMLAAKDLDFVKSWLIQEFINEPQRFAEIIKQDLRRSSTAL